MTGVMTWKERYSPKSRAVIGAEIGYVDDDGYLRFKFSGQKIYVHIAAWALMTGAWPTQEIDHKDRLPAHNAWNNLREATRSQNKANMTAPKTNSSGIKGVSWDRSRGKWRAMIKHHPKSRFIGRFETREAAAEAYAREAKRLFKEFACVTEPAG